MELNDGLNVKEWRWCNKNCGVTNCGTYPEMNCYKEWVKMKRESESEWQTQTKLEIWVIGNLQSLSTMWATEQRRLAPVVKDVQCASIQTASVYIR